MKSIYSKILFVCLISITSVAHADFWGKVDLASGETIFQTGHYDMLIVGQRGVGFKTTQTIHDKKSIKIKIDSLNPDTVDTETLQDIGNVYLFKNSKELLPQILKAKRVEILFDTCGNAFKSSPIDCLFTAKGRPYSVTWEFVTPLAASFEINSLLR